MRTYPSGGRTGCEEWGDQRVWSTWSVGNPGEELAPFQDFSIRSVALSGTIRTISPDFTVTPLGVQPVAAGI